MTVLNEQKLAFRDMTKEERSEIVEAWMSGRLEVYIAEKEVWNHKYAHQPINPLSAFRTRPRQLVIPWEVIKKEYKWAAMDRDGCVFVTTRWMEDIDRDGYWIRRGNWLAVTALNIDTTGVQWKNSLTQRPEDM